MTYRPEIDGLRAIAILAVVAYHVRIPGVTGGFVGVDVFFVLSGYLITSMLLARARDGGAIPILDFYAGRARRLLPAYGLVLVGTGVLGLHLLPATGELQALAGSTIASLAFVSNIYFWQTSVAYFVEPSEWVPLLHTWTLSVEEQFYLVWPLALTLLLRARGRWLLAGIGLALAASFVLAVWAAAVRPVAGFFWMPTRFWELAAGGFLAAATLQGRLRRPHGEPVLASLVLLALLVSPWFLRSSSQFPLLASALPVAMTVYLLWALPASQAGPAGGLLSSAPLVYLGRISYSWYLWHWPLLALGRSNRLGREDFWMDFGVVAVSLGLAALTFRYVENPVRRDPPAWLRRSAYALSAAAILTVALLALAAGAHHYATEIASSDPAVRRVYEAKSQHYRPPRGCVDVPLVPFSGPPASERCMFGNVTAPLRVYLWGDSHAIHYIPAMDRLGKDKGFAVVVRTIGGCQPIIGERVRPSMQGRCERFTEAVLDEIAKGRAGGVFAVILASKWRLPAQEWVEGGQDPPAAWEAGFRRTLERLDALGARVLVMGRVPTFKIPVPECLSRRSAAECAVSTKDHEASLAPIDAAIRSVVHGRAHVVYWSPTPILCPGELCLPIAGDVVMYSDNNHLSFQGAMSMLPYLDPLIASLGQPARGK